MGMPEVQGESVIPDEQMVLVELVIDRPFKDDCKHYTKIQWLGQGDVQPYPARLWPALAAHPDVWRLADQKQSPTEAELEALRLWKHQRQQAAGTGTDLVTATPNPQTLSAEDLAAMSDDDVRAEGAKRKYGLHHRLVSDKLRPAFLATQAAKE